MTCILPLDMWKRVATKKEADGANLLWGNIMLRYPKKPNKLKSVCKNLYYLAFYDDSFGGVGYKVENKK